MPTVDDSLNTLVTQVGSVEAAFAKLTDEKNAAETKVVDLTNQVSALQSQVNAGTHTDDQQKKIQEVLDRLSKLVSSV